MHELLLKPWQIFDKKLDQTGMYRTVTLALLFLVVCSLLFGFLGVIPYGGFELLLSLATIVITALACNLIFSKLWRVHANHESAIITGLIVFFLVLPPLFSELQYLLIGISVSVLAILSKYVIAWKKQHLINPAAAGVLSVWIVYQLFPVPPGFFESSWWIGQPVLFVPLVLAGIAVVTKVRKWAAVTAFLVAGFAVFLYEEWQFTSEFLTGWERYWLSGPNLFLAFFMLTEPFTMPPTKRLQGFYGGLVGGISQTTLFAPFIKITPELALLIGNIIFYPFTLQQKLFLTLKGKSEIAKDTYEFVFEKPKNLKFEAGQYLEWMLPHQASDSRGERRYFTVASSPTEADVRLAMKIPENGSSYKRELQQLDTGGIVIASQLAGDFLLPRNAVAKLGFIAGGIGVTPFRSHVQYMLDSDTAHDTVLYYCCNTEAELAYRDFFDQAKERIAFDWIAVLAHEEKPAPFEHGFITADMLKRRTPDYLERHWYISGPPPMVDAYKKLLKEVGVPSKQVKTDFFPGLA